MMRRFRCGLLCMVAFGVTICRAFSANADTQLKAAWDAFNGTFYDRTDNLCAEYTQKFPTSPHLPEVFLLQARARLEISNYAGAIQLLSKNQDAVGVPKDQFIFWMAEARLREGKVAEANELFARVVREFPASTLRAEATMKQAVGAAKLNDWPNVVNLLANTNGAFQQEASTNSGAQVVLQGYLLLGEAYLKGSNYAAAKAVLE